MQPPIEGLPELKRFDFRRLLGRGGMGVVYLVFDKERGQEFALKTLHNLDSSQLYRLKNEFRMIAGVDHPHLVRLHELFSYDDHYFVLMDFVDGRRFTEYVRGTRPVAARLPPPQVDTSAETVSRRVSVPDEALEPILSSNQYDRLKGGMLQLASGLEALHAMGKLHRDIKPSNVLVRETGHVVILDFGLATDVRVEEQSQDVIAGTYAYMAPEQIQAKPATTAGDWYSVGVMLYESLTGSLPFTGTLVDVLDAKVHEDAPGASLRVPGLSAELDWLCRSLMSRRPDDRANGTDIRRCFAVSEDAQDSRKPILATTPRFAGRQRELDRFGTVLSRVERGSPVVLRIQGQAGIGKTTLLNRLVVKLRETKDAVVLTGRCHERENVPFKAVDGIVDSLCRYLLSRPPEEIERLLPRDVPILARLFPALGRVQQIADRWDGRLRLPDDQELRRRAFRALKQLLDRLSDRHTLAIAIDDMQWGDVDSALLLTELLAPPDIPPMLLMVTFRSEDAQTSHCLTAFAEVGVRSGSDLDIQDWSLGPFDREEAAALAVLLLPGRAGRHSPLVRTLFEESQGHPYFLEELIRESVTDPDQRQSGTGLDLERLLTRRCASLSPEAKRLLQVVAAAGRPIDERIALEAADLDSTHWRSQDVLQRKSLIRRDAFDSTVRLECYHDRIRDAVLSDIEANTLEDMHKRIAITLVNSGEIDPEVLIEHFRLGGEDTLAAESAMKAADRASAALAFDQSATLYRLVLDLTPKDDSHRPAIAVKLAVNAANAGRGIDSAAAYLEAAEGTPQPSALECERNAAEQLLMSGNFDRGVEVASAVLRSVGMRLSMTQRRALVSYMLQRVRSRLRRLRYRQRRQSDIDPSELTRIDVCWSVAVGLTMIDNIRAADFQTRNLLLSLRSGEHYRIARALAMEVGFSGTHGTKTRKRTEALIAEAQTLSKHVGNPHALALTSLMTGVARFYQGRWKACLEYTRQAEHTLLEECTGVAWEVHTARLYQSVALFYMGEIRELSSHVPRFLREGRAQGNLYATTIFRTGLSSVAWLSADDPEGASRELHDAMASWSNRGFHVQHYFGLLGDGLIDLYSGNALEGHEKLTREWEALRRSVLLRIQGIRIVMTHLRARLAVAAAAFSASNVDHLLRNAERDAARLEHEKLTWADSLARLVRAGIAANRHDPKSAALQLEYAIAGFGASGMPLHAICAKRQLGLILGGVAGDSLVGGADTWLHGQAIKRPARFSHMMVPGAFAGGSES